MRSSGLLMGYKEKTRRATVQIAIGTRFALIGGASRA